MKKILIIATVPSMIGQFNMKNIELLLNLEYEVHVACNFKDISVWPLQKNMNFMKLLSKKGIQIHNIGFQRKPNKYYKNIWIYFEIIKLLKKEKFEFLHCHTPIGGVIGRLAGKKTKVPVIYTAHGFHFYKGGPKKNWLFFYPVEWYLSKFTDLLIVINREDYKLAEKHMKARRVVYIPGVGVDSKRFLKPLEGNERKVIRSNLGVSADTVLLISVGELNKRKNHKVVIEALAQKKDLDVLYLICGQGELRDELVLLIEKLGLENKVQLLGYRTDIRELCYASDIFVFPSIREGLGIAALEGMACGLPLVSSYINGIKDYTENGKTGYCCLPDKPDEFAEAIEILCRNPEQRALMGAYNCKKVLDYDIEKIQLQMEKVYSAISIANNNG